MAKEAEMDQGTEQTTQQPSTGAIEPVAETQQQDSGQQADPFDQAIMIPYPDSGDLRLEIAMGPGRLKIMPAAEEASDWITGRYQDPTKSIPLRIQTEGAKTRISQRPDSVRIPRPRGAPVLELQLATGHAFSISIDGGANEIDAELGGLPLTKLDFRFGAGQAKVRFSAPNPTQMERIGLSTGAAEVTFTNLANANASEISVDGGAAAIHLDFGGTLVRDGRARVNVGAAQLDIAVPHATSAKITPHSVLAGIEVGDGFQTKEGAYLTSAAVAGQTPLLTIDATVAIAGLKIKAT
jgi:hypothetical protein